MGGMAVRWILLCAVVPVAGCSQMIESGSIIREENLASCADGSVGYHLPRRKVTMVVDEWSGTKPYRYTLTVSGTLTPAGQLDARYCLRYASNALSTEQIAARGQQGGTADQGLFHRPGRDR